MTMLTWTNMADLIGNTFFLEFMMPHMHSDGELILESLEKEIQILPRLQCKLEKIELILSIVNLCKESDDEVTKTFLSKFPAFANPHYQNLWLDHFKKLHVALFVNGYTGWEVPRNDKLVNYLSFREIVSELRSVPKDEFLSYNRVTYQFCKKQEVFYLLTRDDRKEVVARISEKESERLESEGIFPKGIARWGTTVFTPDQVLKNYNKIEVRDQMNKVFEQYKKNKIKNKMNEQFVQSE